MNGISTKNPKSTKILKLNLHTLRDLRGALNVFNDVSVPQNSMPTKLFLASLRETFVDQVRLGGKRSAKLSCGFDSTPAILQAVHHEEWLMTALIKADTASIFGVSGAGKKRSKLLKSEPLEALKEPRSGKDIPDGGRSQAFRRTGSAWLQISSFRAGIHLYSNVRSISKTLDTVVYSTFDTEDGFSYQLVEKGKMIESYLRSSEDAYEWIREEHEDFDTEPS